VNPASARDLTAGSRVRYKRNLGSGPLLHGTTQAAAQNLSGRWETLVQWDDGSALRHMLTVKLIPLTEEEGRVVTMPEMYWVPSTNSIWRVNGTKPGQYYNTLNKGETCEGPPEGGFHLMATADATILDRERESA
jgi:hypothetical protein